MYPQQRGSLLIQKTVHKTTILTQRTVAQRMISTWRSVDEEHSFDTEGGGREGGFNNGGWWWRNNFGDSRSTGMSAI